MQVTAIVCLALLTPAAGKGFLGTAPDATAEVALERQYNIQIHDVFAKQEGKSDEVVKQVKANKLLSALQISTAPDAAAEVALEKQYNIQIHDDFAKQEGESVQIEKQVKANKELSAMQTSLLQTEDDDVATEEDAEEDKAFEQDDDASNIDADDAVEEDEEDASDDASLLQTDDVDAPPPPPEAVGAYKKKGEESTGVIAMIDLLVKDLDKELTEAETTEKNSQEEYEQLMKDSASKRATDSKALTEKGAAKADTEANLQTHKDDKAATGNELMATLQVIQATHGECDFLLQYFSVRKEARAGEIDSLANAKAVLSGADFSLLQTQTRNLRGRE